jgi:(2Fe-2S) ferredoxin
VRPQDVRDIVREHLRGGRVVERLLYKKKEVTTPPDEPAFEPLPEGT